MMPDDPSYATEGATKSVGLDLQLNLVYFVPLRACMRYSFAYKYVVALLFREIIYILHIIYIYVFVCTLIGL